MNVYKCEITQCETPRPHAIEWKVLGPAKVDTAEESRWENNAPAESERNPKSKDNTR